MNKNIIFLYFVVAFLFTTALIALPFISTDITVSAPGVLRPFYERAEVKAAVSGFIDTVYKTEGSFIKKDEVLLLLQSPDVAAKSKNVIAQLAIYEQQMHDLKLLTNTKSLTSSLLPKLFTKICKEQLMFFINKYSQQLIVQSRAEEDLRINRLLSADKVIAKNELFNKQLEAEAERTNSKTIIDNQLLVWLDQFDKTRAAYHEIKAGLQQLKITAAAYIVRAPVSGVVQNVRTIYTNSFVQAGETLCLVSPETRLVAECMVTAKDVAMIRRNQKVLFRMDAFNYTYFGFITGQVFSIDNDITIIDKTPFFKVRCRMDTNRVSLRNGYTSRLTKGLTLQASFTIARRTLWQLLFDKANDWLNPANHQPV